MGSDHDVRTPATDLCHPLLGHTGTPASVAADSNLYLKMPLDRVRADALHGVRAAREAWRVLDPEGAARVLGRIVEPGHERERVELRTRALADESGDLPQDGANQKHGGKTGRGGRS
jgi:hypothetical protein